MKRLMVIVAAVSMLFAACATPTPTPTPYPTVTPGAVPTMAPTPDNLDINENIILKSDDPRIQNAKWQSVPDNGSSSKDLTRITFNTLEGGLVKMYQRSGWTVYWSVYNDSEGHKFVSNYGIEHVKGTLQDIKVGKGQFLGFHTVQLQINDGDIVVMHLIGRSWAMAFRRHDVSKWEVALINWP